LHTDESRLYFGAGEHFASHETVVHSRKEYARGDVHTNSAEGYFSIFKRGMRGVYQHCKEKHLHRYLAEYDFRYNHRSKLGFDDRARAAKAMEAGSLTPREWDAARSDAAQAEAEVRAYESKLARLQAGARPEEVAQARARLRKAEVAVASARDQLAYTIIKAPISGTVIHRGIEAGEMVTPGVSETGDRKPLLTVADLSKLVVESDINQIDVGKLTLGQSVSIRVDTLPGVAFSGSVYKVAPAAVAGRERDVQLFPIQTIVAHAGADKLKPGMSADLDIFIQKRPHVLLLPVEAVVRDKREQGHVTVVKKGADGHWIKEKRTVTLGTGSDHEVEVVSGLTEGEQVYIDPASAKDNVNQF
jgi:RND family efflux transporter MFP subunit